MRASVSYRIGSPTERTSHARETVCQADRFRDADQPAAAGAAAADRAADAAGACRRPDDRRKARRCSARCGAASRRSSSNARRSATRVRNSRRPTMSSRMPNCSASTIRLGRSCRPTISAAGAAAAWSRSSGIRATLTIPPKAAGFATDGAKAVLRVNVDDYAEVWVNGEMPRAAGRPSAGCDPGLQHAEPAGARRRHRAIPATGSRSPSSRSTARSRRRRPISCGSARRRSSSSAELLQVRRLRAKRSDRGRGRASCGRGLLRRFAPRDDDIERSSGRHLDRELRASGRRLRARPGRPDRTRRCGSSASACANQIGPTKGASTSSRPIGARGGRLTDEHRSTWRSASSVSCSSRTRRIGPSRDGVRARPRVDAMSPACGTRIATTRSGGSRSETIAGFVRSTRRSSTSVPFSFLRDRPDQG